MGNKKPVSLETKGWRGFRHVYFCYCGKQFRHSLGWSSVFVLITIVISYFSTKTFIELLEIMTDMGLKIAPPLLGFTLSGYALVVGVNDVSISELLKTHKTQSGITMYQQLYTTFIAMLSSIFFLLLESVLLNYVIKSDIVVNVAWNIVDIINLAAFSIYVLTVFYAIFAIKYLLSNLFSLGQTANNIYQNRIKVKEKKKQDEGKDGDE